MRRKIILVILSCVLALVPMLAWAQSNDTTTTTKLRIAIPVREFTEFVSVKRNYNTGENNYSGFAIEVFKAVMNSTLRTTPFEFIPFQKSDGSMNGTFDDMLKAVSSKVSLELPSLQKKLISMLFFPRNYNTGENNYSGFAIEVFKAVMNSTLRTTPFEFIPFQKSDGSMNGTFDDMLKAVSSKVSLELPSLQKKLISMLFFPWNYNTGENNYSGFAIEVFKAIMNSTLRTTPFEFIPFQKSDGSMNGTFDDMLKAVSSKDYDGAVGEISILSYRTEWVDFTMPFLDSSITMLVRTKQETASKMAGFSLIGIVKASLIITYILCFVLAAIYFLGLSRWARCVGGNLDRPRDKTLGSLIHTRLLLTTFFLIILIPVACYIISQVSSNTSRRGSSIKTLAELIKPNVNVGYRAGSHVYNLLLQKGFTESNLISLKSEEEMVDKLSRGSSQGGVDSIFANDVHLKLLEAKHCDKFTTVPATDLLASGFGFAFNKGSTITKDVSNGILKMVDDGRLGKIQETTIGKLEACEDDPVDVGSGFLPPGHKWILIVGGLLVLLFILLSLASLY